MTGRTRAVAAAALCLLVTALLGWLTAYGVGLTGPSAPTGSTVEALPSVPPEADVWTPEFGQTLDLTDQRAGRATRPPGKTRSTAPAPAPTTAPRMTPEPPPAPKPTTAPRTEPTEPTTPIVRQGDPCAAAGAIARTRSGAGAVCTAKGNGPVRWRRA